MDRIISRILLGGWESDPLTEKPDFTILIYDHPINFQYDVLIEQADAIPVPRETLRAFLKIMRDHVHTGETILVCCRQGHSRSPAFLIAWLMSCGFSWDEAESVIKKVRPSISPEPQVKKSILEYFEKC